MLRAGELDLMVRTESPLEDSFVSQVLAEDPIVVAASSTHELFDGKPTLKDLTNYRWALQPPGVPTRDWLDHTFDRRHLPRPRVQVESTMLLMLPTLIAETGLLSFISRHHLEGKQSGTKLREPVEGNDDEAKTRRHPSSQQLPLACCGAADHTAVGCTRKRLTRRAQWNQSGAAPSPGILQMSPGNNERAARRSRTTPA